MVAVLSERPPHVATMQKSNSSAWDPEDYHCSSANYYSDCHLLHSDLLSDSPLVVTMQKGNSSAWDPESYHCSTVIVTFHSDRSGLRYTYKLYVSIQ